MLITQKKLYTKNEIIKYKIIILKNIPIILKCFYYNYSITINN